MRWFYLQEQEYSFNQKLQLPHWAGKWIISPLLGVPRGNCIRSSFCYLQVLLRLLLRYGARKVFAGMREELHDVKDNHSKVGIGLSLIIALAIILNSSQFHVLLSQKMIPSIQLPFTIFLQVYLTSSEKSNGQIQKQTINEIYPLRSRAIVAALNIGLFISMVM